MRHAGECLRSRVSRDQKEDGSHGVNADDAARLAFGGWKQAVDGLNHAIGLTGSSPADDAVKVIASHARDIFHTHHGGAHQIGTPMPQHGQDDLDLLAIEDVAQPLTTPGCARH